MPASMWRMNGVLVLCVLLLSNGVMCQESSSVAPDAPAVGVTDAPAPDAAGSPTPDAASGATGPPGDASVAPAAAGDVSVGATFVNIVVGADQDTSVTVAPMGRGDSGPPAAEVPKVVKKVVPEVTCVGKEEIPESNAVKAEVNTADCEATKTIIQAQPAAWCNKDNCNLKIAQEGNTVQVASDDAPMANIADILKSEPLKEQLGVAKVETPSSSGSSVLVGILVTGLLAAIAITVGYLKCQRAKTDTKGVRLAEEAYPSDQENQGNTLVSVAPLNPPPETPEKPSVNGETPEDAKTEPPPPPTNGHSTAKTADTEL